MEQIFSKEDIKQKIRALFALTGSPNEHEAQSALSKAHKLMEKYAIDVFELQKGDPSRYGEVAVFTGLSWKFHHRLIAVILQDYFMVKVYCQRKKFSRRVEIDLFGTKDNCEFGIYVYNFLVKTFEDLWKQKRSKISLRIRSNYSKSFYSGLYKGFTDKLEQEKFVQEMVYNHSTSTALVMITKELQQEAEKKFPKTKKETVNPKLKGNKAMLYGLFKAGMDDGKKINVAKRLT